MIGDDHAIRTVRNRTLGIARREYALHQQLARPHGAQLIEVLPRQRIVLGFALGRRYVRKFLSHAFGVVGALGHAAVHPVLHYHAEQPARPRQHGSGVLAVVIEGHGVAVAHVVFAIGAHGAVHRDHQRFEAGVFGALHQRMRHAHIRPHIKLKPQGATGEFGHVFHAGLRAGGQRKRNVRRLGGTRQLQLALEIQHAGRARGRYAHRHTVLFAEQRDLLIALGDIDQHLRLQLDALKRGAIVAQCNFVFGAPIDKFKQPLRQTALRHRAQIVYVECFLQIVVGHHSPLVDRPICAGIVTESPLRLKPRMR